jgi:hypothetical protein
MKFKAWHGWILGLTAVAVFLGSVAYQGHFESTENQAVAFVSIGLDQSKLPMETSSYEILRASEHFSDIVLGWTAEPSFAKDFAQAVGEQYSFSARRQEKSNLLFTVSGPVETEGTAITLVSLIKTHLAEYNAATNAGYTIALEREIMVTATTSNWRSAAGFTLLILLAETVLLCGYEYARRR